MPIDGYSDRRDSAPRPAAASAKPRSVMAERRRRLLLKRCQPLRQKPPIDYVRGCHAGDTTSPSHPPPSPWPLFGSFLVFLVFPPSLSRHRACIGHEHPRLQDVPRFLGIRSFRRFCSFLVERPRRASCRSSLPSNGSAMRFASLVWESRVEIAERFNFRRRPSGRS